MEQPPKLGERYINTSEVRNLIAASGSALKVGGTIKFPVSVSTSRSYISKDEDGKVQVETLECEGVDCEKKEWRESTWKDRSKRVKDRLWVEFVVVDGLSVPCLLGMDALKNAKCKIDCESEYVVFCGKRVKFRGSTELDSSPITLIQEVTIQPNTGRYVEVDFKGVKGDEVYIEGESFCEGMVLREGVGLTSRTGRAFIENSCNEEVTLKRGLVVGE